MSVVSEENRKNVLIQRIADRKASMAEIKDLNSILASEVGKRKRTEGRNRILTSA